MESLTIAQNVMISKIILGSCYFDNGITKDESMKMMDIYYEHGGRTIDTARLYAEWLPNKDASERVIGNWLKTKKRGDITIVSKGGHPPLSDMHKGRLTKNDLEHDLSKSLEALQTSYIDAYLLHRDDINTPVSDIMDTLDVFVKQGRVKALGASNWTLNRILQANKYAVQNGKTPFSVSEIQWSLARCTSEDFGDDTIVCMSDNEYNGYLKANIPVLAFSSQAKGMFSKILNEGENALNDKIRKRFLTDENRRRIEQVKRLCQKQDCSAAAAALSYITKNPLPAAAIVGCSNTLQLEDSLTAKNINEFYF